MSSTASSSTPCLVASVSRASSLPRGRIQQVLSIWSAEDGRVICEVTLVSFGREVVDIVLADDAPTLW